MISGSSGNPLHHDMAAFQGQTLQIHTLISDKLPGFYHHVALSFPRHISYMFHFEQSAVLSKLQFTSSAQVNYKVLKTPNAS